MAMKEAVSAVSSKPAAGRPEKMKSRCTVKGGLCIRST